MPRAGDWPPEQSTFVLDCTEAEAARIACGARQNAHVWIEAGQVPELRLTVPGCLVVAARRTSDRAPTELACLTEEGGALWLSLRRYAVLATFGRHPWYAAPDMIDGNIVAGIDLTPEPRSGLVVGGPMALVPVERVDLSRPLEALPWFLRLGWVAGHDRLCAVLGI
ncbi:MAG: hypothetical protein ACK4TB_17170 [Gemmobacter sp.]